MESFKQFFRRIHTEIMATFAHWFRTREVLKSVRMLHAQELATSPAQDWIVVRGRHAQEIAAVKSGQFGVIDRRSWAYPYVPEALHRLNQPILKSTPYNLRRFCDTPIPRRAINIIKNSVLSLGWRVRIGDDFDQHDPELLLKQKIATDCLEHPNNSDSYRTLMEAVIEDFIVGGYGTIEPQMTPYFKRPFKCWSVDGSCVTSDTEVLTKRGWLFWPDVCEDDLLATRSSHGEFEWQKPIRLHRQKYEGNLVRFEGLHHNILVTPNHRMYGRRIDKVGRKALTIHGPLEFVPADEVAKWKMKNGCYLFQIPTTSQWLGVYPQSKKVLSSSTLFGPNHSARRDTCYEIEWKDWAAFLGIFVAEGALQGSMRSVLADKSSRPKYVRAIAAAADAITPYNRSHQVFISQSPNSRHLSDIRALLDRLPWKFKWHPESGYFVVGDKALYNELAQLGNKYIKYVPDEIKNLPPELISVFLDWAVKGDGCERNGVRTYVTTSKRLADDVQELFQKIGSTATVCLMHSEGTTEIKGKTYKTAPCYYVQEGSKKWHGIGKSSVVPYSGFVYCASVPNETLYMRRSGMPFWIGNTIRIFANWSESTPDLPHYAQLTGLKGERGIVTFLDDELLYIRDNVKSSTPFGLGCIEVCFQTINAFLGVQDMSARAGSDQIHKTFLWWKNSLPSGQLETVRRHIQNEAEGQAKVSAITGMEVPQTVELNPVDPQDLLLEWQDFLIRIIASGCNLSAMALGIENDVNRSTAETLSEMDFQNAVVPVARKFEEAITRFLLHRFMGWKELVYEYVGLEDPDALQQAQIFKMLYSMDAMTSDEMREAAQIGAPLPGGWGKLTFTQKAILIASATGKPPSGLNTMSTGMSSSVSHLSASPFTADDVSQMDPQDVQMYQQRGLLPQNPQLPQQMEEEQPGILEKLTQELREYFENEEKTSEEDKDKPAKITLADEKAQQKAYKQRQHDLLPEEQYARYIERHRIQNVTRDPFQKTGRIVKNRAGTRFRGPVKDGWSGRLR